MYKNYNIFVTWRPMPLKNWCGKNPQNCDMQRKRSAKLLRTQNLQTGRQTGIQGAPVTALPPQPALTSEKQKILINSIYSNKSIYAQGTDQPAQLS